MEPPSSRAGEFHERYHDRAPHRWVRRKMGDDYGFVKRSFAETQAFVSQVRSR